MAVQFITVINSARPAVRLMLEDQDAKQKADVELSLDEARRLAEAVAFAAHASRDEQEAGGASRRVLRVYDGLELVFEVASDELGEDACRDLMLLRRMG